MGDLATGEMRTPSRFSKKMTVGRSSSCDVVIPHKTVSRTHLEISIEGQEFLIRNLSKRGTTIFETEQLTAEQEMTLRLRPFHIQVGAFLLNVTPVAPTEPFSRHLFVEDTPLIEIDLNRRVPVKFGGQPATLAPIPARALCALARTPGEIVTFDDILAEVDDSYGDFGGGNVNQIVSYIRSGIIEAVEAGSITEAELIDAALDTEKAQGCSGNLRSLMLYVVKNHYKRGYSLNLRERCVSVYED